MQCGLKMQSRLSSVTCLGTVLASSGQTATLRVRT